MEGKKSNGIRVAIVVLAVLLAVSLFALAGILLSRSAGSASAVLPDNIITPDADAARPGSGSRAVAAISGSPVRFLASAGSPETVSLALNSRTPEDNTPFSAKNLFPGDAETRRYSVSVSHSGDVVVKFHAAVRPGYEKLAEVLKCRIALPETGELLYDGLMGDMPQALEHTLTAAQSTTSQLNYEITAYLETSVGNEYRNQELIADFRWWIEDTGNLEPPPTGDTSHLLLWICLAAAALALLLLLWWKRPKEDAHGQA